MGSPSATARSVASRALGRRRVGEAHLYAVPAHALLQLVRRALGDHEAVIDDGDAVSQAVRFVQILRREEDGRAAGGEVLQRIPEREP